MYARFGPWGCSLDTRVEAWMTKARSMLAVQEGAHRVGHHEYTMCTGTMCTACCTYVHTACALRMQA